MPKDYEPILRGLNPKVSWVPCNPDGCRINPLVSKKGRFLALSDYDQPSSKTFHITFRQFTNVGTKPTIHIIRLAGGPGWDGNANDDEVRELVSRLKNHPIAHYTLDHRGLGESGRFIPPGISSFHKIRKQISKIIENSPFPVKDLTTHNAALDITMLAIAIQNEPDYDPSSTWHIMGGSYGSYWGNHVVRLAPNFYDSAYLTATPETFNTGNSAVGVAENCVLDTFCRGKIGGNVWSEFRKAVSSIVDYNHNPCTMAFGDIIDNYTATDKDGRLVLLVYVLRDLILNETVFKNGDNIKPSQVLLPFMKATSDCIDVKAYKTNVLTPMRQYFRTDFLIKNTGNALSNTFGAGDLDKHFDVWVNSVGFIDSAFNNGKPNLIPYGHDDIFDSLTLSTAYWPRYKSLQSYLKGMKFTEHKPLETTKTRVYVEHGRIDLNTTYPPAYQFYKQMKAPMKTWVLWDSLGHGFVINDCRYARVEELIGVSPRTNIKNCVAEDNKRFRLDWTFKGVPDIAKLWDYVKTAPNEEPISKQISSVPNFQRESLSYPIYGKTVKIIGMDIQLSFLWITLVSCFLLGVAVCVYFLFRYFRERSSKDDNKSSVLA